MPDTPPTLPDDEVAARLRAELPGWILMNGRIQRTFRTGGWPTAVLLANAIGFLGEAAGHHPDLEIGYGEVHVRLRTHDADGVTVRDFALAREIERLALWRPASGSGLQGPPDRWVTATRP